MKKLFRRLTDFSLFQQLMIIIFMLVFSLGVFFLVYLRGNIDDFVTSRVMELLRRSQETVVSSVESGQDGYSELSYDQDVMHFVFDQDKFQVYYGRLLYSKDFLAAVTKQAVSHADGAGWVESTFKSDGVYYYRLVVTDNGKEVISIISEKYADSIEQSLLSSVTNTSAIVVMLLILLLMAWVLTIIAPLQQIRSYLERIKKGDETAVLRVDRKDEIGEVAEAIVAMRDQLKQEEVTKEEMVHNISHDLKTPIATIKSYAQSIKDGIYPYDTLEKSVDVILENADRLERKVYSLLLLNRLDYVMDQERDTDKTTDMKAVIEKVMTSLKMIHPDIRVTTDLQDATFKGDEESWRIVVENLVDNALRYAQSHIAITLQPYSLTIYNDGSPISDERMNRLFKPFEKGSKGQFGLGLSICHKVCNTYGYNIDAENQEQGVAFKIVCRVIPKSPSRKLFERRERPAAAKPVKQRPKPAGGAAKGR